MKDLMKIQHGAFYIEFDVEDIVVMDFARGFLLTFLQKAISKKIQQLVRTTFHREAKQRMETTT